MKGVKRFVPLVAVLLCCAAAITAYAGCVKHPNATVYVREGTGYTYANERMHWVHEWREKYCAECGDYCGSGSDIVSERLASHSFVGGECTLCGYRSSSAAAAGEMSGSDLQTEAMRIGANAIGSTAIVINGGNARSGPSTNDSIIGKVNQGETWVIEDWRVVNGNSVWYMIYQNGREMWVSASRFRVQAAMGEPGTQVDTFWLYGRVCEVTAAQEWALTAAGNENNVVGMVQMGQRYMINGFAFDSDGVLWYKIWLNNTNAWLHCGAAAKIY